MTTTDNKRLLTPEDVAERLGVQPATVRAWARDGRIESFKISGRLMRFLPAAVDAFIEAERKGAEG